MSEWLMRMRGGSIPWQSVRWWSAVVALCLLSWFFAPAVLGAAAMVWTRREQLASALLQSVEKADVRGMTVGFLMVWPLLWLANGSMTPGDDVLRHFTAWRHDYDYHRLYVFLDPRFPHQSMWFGYEWLIGHLHRALGLQLAIPVLQVIIYAAAAYSLWRVALVLVPDRPDAWTWRLLFIAMLLLTQLIFRIGLARPEVVFAIWAMSALWMRPWQWLLVGVLLQPLYWLAIVYAPAAALLQANWRTRAVCAAVLAAVCTIFWLGYAGLDWPRFFWLSHAWIGLRLASVGENESIFIALLVPIFTATVGLVLWRAKIDWRRDATVLGLLAWFLMPGQIRYLATVHLLIIVLLARGTTLPSLRPQGQLAVLAAVLVFAAYGMTSSGRLASGFHNGLPHFKTLHPGDQVLTAFDQATYLLPSENPGIRSAPAMELGATAQPVQALAVHLAGVGAPQMDCRALADFGFTHVVEKRMPAAAPCLELQEISNGWRLWRVRTAAT